MKFFRKAKDGGPYSTVTGYWLAEVKSLFSVALLKFENGSRESYHSHAFDAVSWVLTGRLREEHHDSTVQPVRVEHHVPSFLPIVTRRSTFHRVFSEGTTWVFTLRGPWADRWLEFDPTNLRYSILEHGRRLVGAVSF